MYKKKLLRAELALKELTYTKLGKILKISNSTLSRKINAKSEWKLEEIQMLSKVLGLSKINEIFFN